MFTFSTCTHQFTYWSLKHPVSQFFILVFTFNAVQFDLMKSKCPAGSCSRCSCKFEKFLVQNFFNLFFFKLSCVQTDNCLKTPRTRCMSRGIRQPCLVPRCRCRERPLAAASCRPAGFFFFNMHIQFLHSPLAAAPPPLVFCIGARHNCRETLKFRAPSLCSSPRVL